MASGGMIYVPSVMTIGSGSQVILRLLPQQSERLQCWYYWWEEFIKYVVQMVSGGKIYIWRFMMIDSGIQLTSRLLPQEFERLQCWYYWCEWYIKCVIKAVSDGMTYMTVNDDWFRHSSNITGTTSTTCEVAVLVLPMAGFIKYALRWHHVVWYTYIPSFMKLGIDIQAILILCLISLRGCNMGITDERDLWIAPLRWTQVSWYTKFQTDYFRSS
jgi:hypothetical protein